MAPQKFADLGKEAKDLISKNFHFGTVKLEAKTKSANGVNFTTEGAHNTDSGDVAGSLETKFAVPKYGVTVNQKWNTGNILSGTVSVDSKLVDGLKVDVDASASPGKFVTGSLTTKLKIDYSGCDYLRATTDIASADLTAPSLNVSGVLAYKGWHAGVQGVYDAAASKLVEQNVAVVYKSGPVTLMGAVLNSAKYQYSVSQEVNKSLSVAAQLQCDAGSETAITLAGKYDLDDSTFVKAKLDNKLRLGVSYVQNMGAGVTATLSGLVNGKSLDEGGHKIGFHLNFDA